MLPDRCEQGEESPVPGPVNSGRPDDGEWGTAKGANFLLRSELAAAVVGDRGRGI